MAQGLFPFFRATFYRWLQLWPDICPDLVKAPRLLAVGDLHVENFGTWRDIEGRLVWGINDFDEAAVFPYTLDLVRLAASALLACNEGHIHLKDKDACAAIVDGYRQSLSAHGRPFVLEEENQWLRLLATSELRDPVHFWKKMEDLPKASQVPVSAREALEHVLPEPTLDYRTVRRVAGLGSLGHIRIVAIAECHGGLIAREAKALAPSSVYWAEDVEGPHEILYQAIITRAVRDRDPFVRLRGQWIVRRLSPHCSRIELTDLPVRRDDLRLLYSMGWETANVHLGSPGSRKEVLRHLGKSKAAWLQRAAHAMIKATTEDWKQWKRSPVVQQAKVKANSPK